VVGLDPLAPPAVHGGGMNPGSLVVINFRSDFTVKLNPRATVGSDSGLAYAAWVTDPDAADPRDTLDGRRRVLKPCMTGGHNTVFEHGLMSVYIEAPGVVWWQLTRQRFMSVGAEDLSFNLDSGRYRHAEPEFYIPPVDRPLREPDGFKPMRPEHVVDDAAFSASRYGIKQVVDFSWEQYRDLLRVGVAREVARLVLPQLALYVAGYVTAKPLSWLQFFSKRNKTVDTTVATFPQWEIEKVAAQAEEIFAALWPETHAQFLQNGRRAPS